MEGRTILATRRVALALVALVLLLLALAGCQQGALPGQNNTTQIQIITPNPGQLTPTPTFPPFTVGAWPSNYSPQNKDTITIYVICRVQPAGMTGPGTPPSAGLNVQVQVAAPVNQTYQGTTDADGMAAITFSINDSQSGVPVVVTNLVNYNGQTYVATTFFTPNPTATPTPTVKPNQTPTATP
jgi:hypothetical protein